MATSQQDLLDLEKKLIERQEKLIVGIGKAIDQQTNRRSLGKRGCRDEQTTQCGQCKT